MSFEFNQCFKNLIMFSKKFKKVKSKTKNFEIFKISLNTTLTQRIVFKLKMMKYESKFYFF